MSEGAKYRSACTLHVSKKKIDNVCHHIYTAPSNLEDNSDRHYHLDLFLKSKYFWTMCDTGECNSTIMEVYFINCSINIFT